MKILLINPPRSDSIVADMSDFFDKSAGTYPPLGLMYLASSLAQSGKPEIRILDAGPQELDYSGIGGEISLFAPDVVGITTLTFSLPAVLKTAAAVKAVDRNIAVVLGGPHATIYPEETLAFPDVDYVVMGEGEAVFAKLVDAIYNHRVPEELGSIGFKSGDRLHVNHGFSFIDDLDKLPFPSVGLIRTDRYFSVLSSRRRTMIMMSSRGCPFRCIYCDRPHLGKKFRGRSPINVVDEIEVYVRKYGITDIKFFDDTFTVNRQRVLDICSEIQRRKLAVTWSVRARVNTVDGNLLDAMKNSGLNSISFGIESGSQEVLDNLQKGTTVEQAADAVRLCRKLGIEVLGDFILGCPGERREQIEETIRCSRRLGLDYAQFTVMTPYPSTELYRVGLEKKILVKDYWREFARKPDSSFETPVWTEFFSKEELVGLLKKAYRSFYFRPAYVMGRLRRIRSIAEVFRKASVFLLLLMFNIIPAGKLSSNFRKRNS